MTTSTLWTTNFVVGYLRAKGVKSARGKAITAEMIRLARARGYLRGRTESGLAIYTQADVDNWIEQGCRYFAKKERGAMETADQWMNKPISEWPETLKITVNNAGKQWGHSGEVFYECMQAWLKSGKRALTAEEIIAELTPPPPASEPADGEA